MKTSELLRAMAPTLLDAICEQADRAAAQASAERQKVSGLQLEVPGRELIDRLARRIESLREPNRATDEAMRMTASEVPDPESVRLCRVQLDQQAGELAFVVGHLNPESTYCMGPNDVDFFLSLLVDRQSPATRLGEMQKLLPAFARELSHAFINFTGPPAGDAVPLGDFVSDA